MKRWPEVRELKRPIREFLQVHYSDERLSALLCHARDGKLAYFSCCCLVGISTSDHALRGNMGSRYSHESHYLNAAMLPGASEADAAYCNLGFLDGLTALDDTNVTRRRILIPMVRAEMKRREKEKIIAEREETQSSSREEFAEAPST